MVKGVQQFKFDDREKQAVRVADYLEQNPASTLKEIDAACDTGCVSKVLSDMQRQDMPGMGYGIKRAWRPTLTREGLARRLRTYTLIHRPARQPDLFTPP